MCYYLQDTTSSEEVRKWVDEVQFTIKYKSVGHSDWMGWILESEMLRSSTERRRQSFSSYLEWSRAGVPNLRHVFLFVLVMKWDCDLKFKITSHNLMRWMETFACVIISRSLRNTLALVIKTNLRLFLLNLYYRGWTA